MNDKNTRKKYPVTVSKCPNGQHHQVELPDDVDSVCAAIANSEQGVALVAELASRGQALQQMHQAVGWLERGLALTIRDEPENDARLFELAVSAQILRQAILRRCPGLSHGLTLDALKAAEPHMIEVPTDA